MGQKQCSLTPSVGMYLGSLSCIFPSSSFCRNPLRRGVLHSPQGTGAVHPWQEEGLNPGRKEGLAGGTCPACALWDIVLVFSYSVHTMHIAFLLLAPVFYYLHELLFINFLSLSQRSLCYLVSCWILFPKRTRHMEVAYALIDPISLISTCLAQMSPAQPASDRSIYLGN